MKLYGGAQFQRLLHEFELVAHSCEVPQISVHEVAAALGGAKVGGDVALLFAGSKINVVAAQNLTTSAFQSAVHVHILCPWSGVLITCSLPTSFK